MRWSAERADQSVGPQRGGAGALLAASPRTRPPYPILPSLVRSTWCQPEASRLHQRDPRVPRAGAVDGDDLRTCLPAPVRRLRRGPRSGANAGAGWAGISRTPTRRARGGAGSRVLPVCSWARSAGVRSVRTPRYAGWRSRPSVVRRRYCTSTTRTGLTHTVPTRSRRGSSSWNGDRSTIMRGQQLREEPPRLAGDAAADAAAELQPVGRGLTDQHRPQPVGRPGLVPEAAHDVGAGGPDRELQPVTAALARPVPRGQPLADDPLEPLLLGRGVAASARRRTSEGPARRRRPAPEPSSCSRRSSSGRSHRSSPSRRSRSKAIRVTGLRLVRGAGHARRRARASGRRRAPKVGTPSPSATTSPSSRKSSATSARPAQLGEGDAHVVLVARPDALAPGRPVHEQPHAVPLHLVDPAGTGGHVVPAGGEHRQHVVILAADEAS